MGTTLLRRLEEALHVTFDITMKEEAMSTRIEMGNDEFILYIRKNYEGCATDNDDLGHRIWVWIEGHDPAAIQLNDRKAVPCLWGDTEKIRGKKLPIWATQFEFKRSLLPELYEFLDSLGSV